MITLVSFTDASHNMLFTLSKDKWLADLAKSGKASLVGYQEAEGRNQRTTLNEYCTKNDRKLYLPAGTGCGIGWKKGVFGAYGPDDKPFQGMKRVHTNAEAMGFKTKYLPSMEFVYVGLYHHGAKKSVLRINVHPISGATRTVLKDNDKEPGITQWKNWAIQQYWLDVLSFTAKEMSRGVAANSMKRFWDVIIIGGDYNGDLHLAADDEWYYPSRMLPALYAKDRIAGGLDHMQHAYGSDVAIDRRWQVPANSDHNIHFTTRTFKAVDDTPGK